MSIIRVTLMVLLGFLPTTTLAADLVAQTKHVRATCFPTKLTAVLQEIQRRAGKSIVLTSGHRHSSKRKASYHKKCMAADFRIKGVSPSKMRKIVASIPGVGGFGSYSKKPGLYHVDIGPKRTWSY